MLAVAVAGCASSSVPPPIAHATPPPVGCLPSALRDGHIVGLVASQGGATVCYSVGSEESSRACLALDGAGAVTGKAEWQDPKEAAAARYSITGANGTYTVCVGETTQCTSFKTSHKQHEYLTNAGAVSADGSLAFVLDSLPPPKPDDLEVMFGELYEVKTGKQLARVKLTAIMGEHGFSDYSITRAVELHGRKVIVAEVPAGPAGSYGIVDPVAGKALFLHGYDGQRLSLDARTLLVLDGDALSVIDVESLAKREQLKIPGQGFSEPEQSSTMMAKVGASIVIAYAQPAGVVVFDPKTRKLAAPRPLPICP